MPVKQFNSTLCQRNTDGRLISFNSAFTGKLSLSTNTWGEPHHEARVGMFTVNDVNVKLKVRNREKRNLRLHMMRILAYSILNDMESNYYYIK